MLQEQSPHNTFRVNIPITLDKAGETDSGWKIRGLASTDDVDLQGEIVKQHGLDVSPIKDGRGWINYNHSNVPEDMVGKLDDADVSSKGMMVEGYLFKKHQRAQSIYQILKSLDDKDRQAVKLSIEGKILKRTGKDNKVIASAKVDKVAITFDPINTNTYVELVKAITDKTKEWSMDQNTATEFKLDEQPIKSEGDVKVESHPANSADDAMIQHQNDEDLPGKEYSGKQGKKQEDVFALLTQIKDMLSVLTQDHMAKKEEAVKAETASALKSMIAEQVRDAMIRKGIVEC